MQTYLEFVDKGVYLKPKNPETHTLRDADENPYLFTAYVWDSAYRWKIGGVPGGPGIFFIGTQERAGEMPSVLFIGECCDKTRDVKLHGYISAFLNHARANCVGLLEVNDVEKRAAIVAALVARYKPEGNFLHTDTGRVYNFGKNSHESKPLEGKHDERF